MQVVRRSRAMRLIPISTATAHYGELHYTVLRSNFGLGPGE